MGRKCYGMPETGGCIPNRVSFLKRPDAADMRSVVGHWEAGTVGGAKHQVVIATATGRRSQFFADPYASYARLIP